MRQRWWRPAAICCGVYFVLATLEYGHLGSLSQGHMTGFLSPDAIEQIWWLAWTAYALPHAHNVFLAQWQNYPAGENFGVNGSMLTLGVLLMPITKLFGPVVTWNVALRLAVALSASSMCLVLRRWTTWWPAAFVGGLLYGFSGYAAYYGNALLFLIFVPLPPVIFLLLHEILVRQRWRPGRTGALLGAVCVVQFFIWVEILASTLLMGAIAVALFVAVSRHDLVKRWRYAVTAFAYSLCVGCLLLFLPLLYTLAGPQSIKGAPLSQGSLTLYPSDLLGAIVPSSQWLSTTRLAAIANQRFVFATALYIGIPLVVALVLFAVFLRKRRAILFAGTMALIAFVLSLGPRLWVDGRETPVRLPFVILLHLPDGASFAPVRFSLFTALFAAVMFAVGLDEFWQRLRRSSRPAWLSSRWRIVAAAGASAALAVAVVFPLVPRHTQPTSPTNVPSFFTSAAVDAIPPGSVVLAYPYPDFSNASVFFPPSHKIMLDQAVAGMRFKLIGGYGWFPSPTGLHGTVSPSVLRPKSVQATLDAAYQGATSRETQLSKNKATADLRVFLRRYGVQTVVALPEGAQPATAISYISAAIGSPVESGGVTVWLHVKRRLLENPVQVVPVTGGSGAALPQLRTNVVRPAPGARLSGTTALDAIAEDDYSQVTKVEFYLTGLSQHDSLIGTGRSTIVGWIAPWNTTGVPNGKYTLQSVAYDAVGRSSHSNGVTVIVKN